MTNIINKIFTSGYFCQKLTIYSEYNTKIIILLYMHIMSIKTYNTKKTKKQKPKSL